MTEEPIRVIRPVVVPSQFWVAGPAKALVGALPIGFAIFVTSNNIIGFTEFGKPIHDDSFGPKGKYGIVGYFLAAAAILALCYVKTFVEPGRIVYRIYPNR